MSGPWWVAGPALGSETAERKKSVGGFFFGLMEYGYEGPSFLASFFSFLVVVFLGNWHLRRENFKASIACRLLEPDRI